MSASARGVGLGSRPTTAGSFVALDSPRRAFFRSLNDASSSKTSSPRRPCSGRSIPASDLLTTLAKSPRQKPPFGSSSPRPCMPVAQELPLQQLLQIPRPPAPADAMQDVDRTIDWRLELEKFNAALAAGVTYAKPVEKYSLLTFLFRRTLAIHTNLNDTLHKMTQDGVLARFRDMGVRETRMNPDEFYFVMCDLLRDPRLPRHESDRLFQAMDWNASGIVDSDEITIGLNVMFQSQEGSIAVFAKKTLDSRAATDAFISLHEVNAMLSSIASLCDGRYNGAQGDVKAVMNRLQPLARDGVVPLEWVQDFVAAEAPLISKVLSEMPLDGSMPTPAALGRLPSPDPVRDVKGIHAAIESKRQALTVAPIDSERHPGIAQEALQNPRFRADAFINAGSRNVVEVPEHQPHEYYSINGVVWRRTEKGPEVVS